MINEIQSHGERNNFRYLLENIKKANNPICNNKAVYLLLKANPIAIPAQIQYPIFCSKIARYKNNKLNVQNNINGTSGVELKESIEMNTVEPSKIILRQTLCAGRNIELSL